MQPTIPEIEAQLAALGGDGSQEDQRIDLMVKLAGLLVNADAPRAAGLSREIWERSRRAGCAAGQAHSLRIDGT